MDLIETKQLKVFIFDFVYTLASANIDQSGPNLVKIYMTSISLMSSILCLIGPEQPQLVALELGKIAAFDIV